MSKRIDEAGFWSVRVLSLVGMATTVWIAISDWSMLVHGQPTYAVLIALTFLASLGFALRSWRKLAQPKTRWRVLRSLGIVASMLWIILMGWLAPSVAAEPALNALSASSGYTVSEDASQIVLMPIADVQPTALFFQPGARVDARAYAAVLAPVAEAGHIVVIPKQPLGIAFLSTTVFESTRTSFPEVKNWVVGGHSLGGTVAAIDAEKFCEAQSEPVVGLLLFASYPATNMSNLNCSVLSISGTQDGLATPEKIHSSETNLPATTHYIFIEGGVHAFFGDYGTQTGDGTPTISHTQARDQISKASVEFLNSFDK